MRRWAEDLKNDWISGYFRNMDIAKMTDNKYNTIIKFKSEILFAKNVMDKDGNIKTVKGEKIRICNTIIIRTTLFIS